MATGGSGSGSGPGSTVQSLPPPRPKSPPDLYGRRKEMVRLQVLEREKSFLEEELKFVERLQPASRCCKEMVDFVTANADPLLPTKNRKIGKSCYLWKWLCGSSCFKFSWACCYTGCCTGCSLHLKTPKCCSCKTPDCSSCLTCFSPECSNCCWCNPCSCTCPCNSCSGSCPSFSNCCCSRLKTPSCFDCCSCECKCSCPKCPTCSGLCNCSCACPKCPTCSGICNSCFGCITNCCCCCGDNNCCICC
ncbi:Guanine nucleotide-binding protein subunit gamma 3 [Bienertia sinuspersici]